MVKFNEKQIRILPMSRLAEFQDYDVEDIQRKFFNDEFITKNKGRYHFRKKGMKAAGGSIVLFQYEGLIVATAVLSKVLRFEEKRNSEYAGAYEFDLKSMRTFQPITFYELKSIIPTIKSFSQAQQIIDIKYADRLENLIQSHENMIIADEVEDSEQFYEGSKKRITVNSYERDYKAREKCIEHYGSKCFVCGFDFGKVYGNEYFGKIHVHHLVPLNEIGERYKCNPIKDLRPVCPNCHLILHTKVEGISISISDLKERMNR